VKLHRVEDLGPLRLGGEGKQDLGDGADVEGHIFTDLSNRLQDMVPNHDVNHESLSPVPDEQVSGVTALLSQI
jgi:hypothetical protein